MNTVEVCFTPAIYEKFHKDDSIVVIVDILRATSSICTAFYNGAKKIIPVGTLDEAKRYKEKGFIVAAERDGIKRDFADFGNSPFNFTKEIVEGKEIVYSTTNGTQCILKAKNAYKVVIGSYLNLTILENFLEKENKDVVILCAGWKDKFNLEDTLFCGALAERLLQYNNFHTICDSVHASIDLWNIARKDIINYIEKAAQRHRLKKNNLDDVIEYCHTIDAAPSLPVLEDYYLINALESF